MAASSLLSCDIFCRVVDNFGDIGVSWRLARQLANERGIEVRLIVDDSTSLKKITAGLEIDDNVQWCGISDITDWNAATVLDVANIVIEAFACKLPDEYVEKMASSAKKTLWINLEYLSAEPWITEHHLLPSPHPCYPLTKYFFFPGFQSGTGGLIREASVLPCTRPVVRTSVEVEYRVFVFGYDSPRAMPLLDAINRTSSVYSITIPEGALADAAKRIPLTKLDVVPFVPQIVFDSVLAKHDILFVRGEDSFVRALYAAKPLVWQIYPQEGGAHMLKLDAFLALYCRGLTNEGEAALRAIWFAVNEGAGDGLVVAWQNFLKSLPELKCHAEKWQKQLLLRADLVTNLMTFYEKFLKI
ncbi:MAG: elongation factor P maturation arginine rhamnosyltransferase EarP [Pseudomonadota bacterium]